MNPPSSALLQDLPLHRLIEIVDGPELEQMTDAQIRDAIQLVAQLRGQPQARRASAKRDVAPLLGKKSSNLLDDFA